MRDRRGADRRAEARQTIDFETLIAELSLQFINLPPGEVDREIEDAQGRICEFLGLDLSALWQLLPGTPSNYRLTHIHHPPDFPPVPEVMDAGEYFPWCLAELLAGRTVVVSSVDEAPEEAAHDKEVWRYFGLNSSLTLPLSAGRGPYIGFLSFNTIRERRDWPVAVVKRLQLVAQVFTNALVRKRAEEDLRESEARLRLAAEAGGIGMWALDVATGRFWGSEKDRELFGFFPNAEVTLARFLESVHADDRDPVRGAVLSAVAGSHDIRIEYRIIRPDGSVRWILSRGRAQAGTPGKPARILGASMDVTERREYIARLLQSGARLETANDVAGLGCYETGSDWRSAYVDDRLRSLLGIPANAMVDVRGFWIEHLHPDDLATVLALSRAVMEEGQDFASATYRFVHPERGTLWFNQVSRVLERDEKGAVRRVFGVVQDVTAFREAQEALERAQAHTLALMNSTDDLIWSVDSERHGLLSWNQALHDAFASFMNIELAVGMTPEELLTPELAATWHTMYRRAMGEGSLSTEYSDPSDTNTLLLSIQPMERDGQVFGLSVFARDITALKQARETLEKVQAQTLAVMNSTHDLIWSVDPQRHGLLTWNRALRDYFFNGVDLEIAVGMPPEELLPPAFAAKWHELYSRALESGSFTEEYGTATGGFTLLLSIQPVRRDGKVFAISVFGKDITDFKRSEEALKASLAEVTRLKSRLEAENQYLREDYRLKLGHGVIVGESPAISGVLAAIEQVAATKTTVLIEGETGVGKELVARRIHELSPRARRPLVKVNCAALPSTLVESELFGREKGAFTGSVSREQGRFELADGSTIFLDEIGELPLELQGKLLHVLESGQFERVGSPRTLQTDVRVVAATNRDIEAEVKAGRFRRDLYYRISTFPIRVPPLRERRDDIPLLTWAIVEELAPAMNKQIRSIPRRVIETMKAYDWPGNVRELRNVIERALILGAGPVLTIDVPNASPTPADAVRADAEGAETATTLDEAQRRQIQKVLQTTGGRISGPGGAAELLGLRPTTLRSRMMRLGMIPHRRGADRSSA